MKINQSVQMEWSSSPIEGRYTTLRSGLLVDHEISWNGLVVSAQEEWSPFKPGDLLDLESLPPNWGSGFWWESKDPPPILTGAKFTFEEAKALFWHDPLAIEVCGARARFGRREEPVGTTSIVLEVSLVGVGDEDDLRVTYRTRPKGAPDSDPWSRALVLARVKK